MLKHTSENEKKALSSFLLYEIDPRWCREGGEFAPTAVKIPLGAVLCQNDRGQYLPFGTELEPAVAAAEGAEAKDAVTADKPVAVLLSQEMEVSESAQPCVAARRGACVAKSGLFWLETVTEEQKKQALADLSAIGILIKE